MPLRIGMQVDYVVGTQENPPGLKLTLFINGKEGLIKFLPWMDLIRKSRVRENLILDNPISKQRMRRAATQQERETAEALGGYRQTGSGARQGYKGDGRVFGRFRIENKFTTRLSFSVKLRELTKIRAECAAQEVPIFDVQFKEKGTLKTVEHWALIPWSELKKYAENNRGSEDQHGN